MFFIKVVKMYNDLPTEVRQCERLDIFKRRLNNYIKHTVVRL